MINVKKGTQSQGVKPFPKLMIDENEQIFYFVRDGYGLPLTGSLWNYELAGFADFSHSVNSFIDYNEPITLQNA